MVKPSPTTLTVATAPTSEPITLAEARAHLRIDGNDEDALIERIIRVARETCERLSGLSFMEQTLRLYLDRFPCADGTDQPTPERAWAGLYGGDAIIELHRPPIQSVTSIQYVDADGTTQTLSASAYRTDLVSMPGRISPAHGTAWPETRDVTNAVIVTYVAGAASVDLVPAAAGQAMLLLIGHLYENRQQVVTGTIASNLPMGVIDLLNSIRVPFIP